ncbi:3D domain-containing protein [Romboutsia sp.]|uniref:3D domain-containing protein n=1 Tax=Romboutsia sp. TaxID=1965302 RepID=UPI002BD60E62|nr:3D domain-containing protein [Romboutsia sp.]HSQ88192.1 3D domain-containing protein [Romboutsia sp.]
MSFKNNKILKVSALAGILSVGVMSGGYSLLNKDVTLVVKGEKSTVSTFKSNVKDLLEEQNIKYDGNDIISIGLDSKLSDGTEIEVIDVREETIKENKEVPFEVNIVEDKELLKGKTEVAKEGQVGKNELVYKVTYHNGKKVEQKFTEELVAIEPINKVVKKGTKVEVQVASSRGENMRKQPSSNSNKNTSSNNQGSTKGKNIKVVATAYTGDSITSTGTKPKWGTIAVDPSVIPYGTKVYIPQFGKTFIAEDCGSAIKGNKIDIYMNDENSANSWGRKTIDICIIG